MLPSDRDTGKSQRSKGTDHHGNPVKAPSQPGSSCTLAKPAAGPDTKGQCCPTFARKKPKQERNKDTTTVNAVTAPLITAIELQSQTTNVRFALQSPDVVPDYPPQAATVVIWPPDSFVFPMLEVLQRYP